MSLLLTLVSAGDYKHGSAVSPGNTGRPQSDCSGSSLLATGLIAGRATRSESIIRVCRGAAWAGAVCRGTTATTKGGADENVNGGIDLDGHVVDERVWVGVQGRRRDLVVQSQ